MCVFGGQDYQDDIPQIVILGAKGSGKTYLYKQMLASKTWRGFAEAVIKENVEENKETLILPFLSTVNIKYIQGLAEECVKNVNTVFEEKLADRQILNNNYNEILSFIEQTHSLTEWTQKWTELITLMAGGRFSNLTELDGYLEGKEKKLVFVADGLEDLFMDAQIQKNENWKYAFKSLCQKRSHPAGS